MAAAPEPLGTPVSRWANGLALVEGSTGGQLQEPTAWFHYEVVIRLGKIERRLDEIARSAAGEEAGVGGRARANSITSLNSLGSRNSRRDSEAGVGGRNRANSITSLNSLGSRGSRRDAEASPACGDYASFAKSWDQATHQQPTPSRIGRPSNGGILQAQVDGETKSEERMQTVPCEAQQSGLGSHRTSRATIASTVSGNEACTSTGAVAEDGAEVRVLNVSGAETGPEHEPSISRRSKRSSEATRRWSIVSGRPSMISRSAHAAGMILDSRVRQRSIYRQSLWNTLNIPDSSFVAKRFSMLLTALTMLSVLFTLIQTIEEPVIAAGLASLVETAVDTVFAFEVFLRFVASPRASAFFQNPYNLVDSAAVMPRFVHWLTCLALSVEEVDGTLTTVVLCLALVLRLLKLMRHFEKFRLFLSALGIAMEAIPVCLYAMIVLTVVSSALLLFVEPEDNIGSLPKAMWLAIVTMTTVGYGDVTPQSAAGSVIVAIMVICSVLYMAMPVGIVGQAFSQVWEDRDRILLTQRTKEHLAQWGFCADDMEVLFQFFDQDGNGELDLAEFRELMTELRIGISDRRVIALFESIDRDQSGCIDAEEFVRVVFPGQAT